MTDNTPQDYKAGDAVLYIGDDITPSAGGLATTIRNGWVGTVDADHNDTAALGWVLVRFENYPPVTLYPDDLRKIQVA